MTTGSEISVLRMFYFSGTGNARNVAAWMASAWADDDRPAEVVNLAKVDPARITVGPEDEVGLASPTHGFNFPPITLSFIWAFPRAPARNRVFIFNTRAGLRLFRLPLPGLSGVAQLLAALLFMAKGYRIGALRPIDLPSNWISLHPGPRVATVAALHARCERIVRRSADRLVAGRRDLRALWDLPQDLAIAPISLLYYLVGRFIFAKSFIASADCDACGTCERNCPVQAIELVDGRPFWTHRCESCMRCMSLCPKRAIETAHGFVIGVLVLLSVGLGQLVYPAARPWVPALFGEGLLPGIARFVVETLLMLGVLFGAYRLLHRALRFRVVERAVVLTALTHFGFWRRYRAPRVERSRRIG